VRHRSDSYIANPARANNGDFQSDYLTYSDFLCQRSPSWQQS
jgi:hypothetical protein